MQYRLGVLGGMGPQATNTFYQFVIDRTDARTDQEHVDALIPVSYTHLTLPTMATV